MYIHDYQRSCCRTVYLDALFNYLPLKSAFVFCSDLHLPALVFVCYIDCDKYLPAALSLSLSVFVFV